ncbi:hypothetical protein O1M63_50540 [Streptomyces mirabilis]|nr:hypothetical protein [Streptomyces mirabilis]
MESSRAAHSIARAAMPYVRATRRASRSSPEAWAAAPGGRTCAARGPGASQAGQLGLGGADRFGRGAEVGEGGVRLSGGQGQQSAGPGGRPDQHSGPARESDLLAVVGGEPLPQCRQDLAQLGLESAPGVERGAHLGQQHQRGHRPSGGREPAEVRGVVGESDEPVRPFGVLTRLAQREGEPGPPDGEVAVPFDGVGQTGGEQVRHPALFAQQPVGLPEAGLVQVVGGDGQIGG